MIFAGTAGSFLVGPVTLAPQTWFGWFHHSRGPVDFQGKALRFEVQGVPIPDGPLRESGSLSTRLAGQDTIRLSASVITGLPVVGRAQLVGIVAGAPGAEYLSLWQEGRSLLAYVRLGLADAGLRQAWFRLEEVFPETAGDTLQLGVTVTRNRLVMVSDHHQGGPKANFRLSAVLFWASLLPFEFQAGVDSPLWPLLPMGLAFLTLGLGTQNRAALGFAGAFVLLGGPLLAGAALPQPWELITGALGAAVGRLLAARLDLFPEGGPPISAVTNEPHGE